MSDQKQSLNEETISLPAAGNKVLLVVNGKPTAIATPTGIVSESAYFTDIEKIIGEPYNDPKNPSPYKSVRWGGDSALQVQGDRVTALRAGNERSTSIDSPELAAAVRGLLADALTDGTTVLEEAKLNYTIDDIVDNGRRDFSVPAAKESKER